MGQMLIFMKIFILILFTLLTTNLFAQDEKATIKEKEVAKEEPAFETFEMKEGDTTYLMKKYFMCFLKAGPKRDQTEEEQAKIQEGHMANINKLAEDKKICIAGPFGDDGDIRGILIFNVPTMEEAEKLAAQDPAVQAGRLIMEFHPWWAAVGSKLF